MTQEFAASAEEMGKIKMAEDLRQGVLKVLMKRVMELRKISSKEVSDDSVSEEALAIREKLIAVKNLDFNDENMRGAIEDFSGKVIEFMKSKNILDLR